MNFQVGPGERGSGNIVTETRTVTAFKAIEVDYPAQVFITQGARASRSRWRRMTTSCPGLQTRVRNDTLEIFYKVDDGGRINPTKPVKITIVVKDLQEVDFESAGELSIDGLENRRTRHFGQRRRQPETERSSPPKDLSVTLSGAREHDRLRHGGQAQRDHQRLRQFHGKDLHSQTADVELERRGQRHRLGGRPTRRHRSPARARSTTTARPTSPNRSAAWEASASQATSKRTCPRGQRETLPSCERSLVSSTIE
ncbi:MAG: DUF2807 domain-containing protein [Sphingobacterium sp.]|nr:DUF2807 domain-containing protein [Sphingobacterium sp.]